VSAAYILWRLNWIHPFAEGNGRTARAVAYLVLSVQFGRELPGEITLVERMSQRKRDYWHALEAADRAWAT
jgi:Fic family protein